MAPLAENLTARLWVKQSGQAGDHETLFRFPTGTSVSTMVTQARNIVTEVRALLSTGVSFVSARYSNAGSNLSFPASWGAAIAGLGSTPATGEKRPQFLSFTGRGEDGRRTRITFFGYAEDMSVDYRIAAGTNLGVQDVIDAIYGSVPDLVTASGSVPIWNGYANLGRNAYYQRKLRRTG